MADTSAAGPAPGAGPAAAGQQHDDGLAAIVAALNGPNPHWAAMNLPPALCDDGARS